MNRMQQGTRAPLRAVRRDFALAAIAAGLGALLWLTGLLHPLERATGDALLRLTHRSVVDAPVAVIAVDDRAVEAIGPLPWPRSHLAGLVDAARDAGAAVVALDILLNEPADPDDDLELADALDDEPSLLAAALGPDGGWLLPDPRFGGPARAAHVHAEVGPDGVVRMIAQTKQSGAVSLPALSLAAAEYLDPAIVIEPGGLLRPDFRPAPEQVRRVSAADLLPPTPALPDLSGRAVLIGVTATGVGDRLMVPTHPGPAPAAGVLVHASITASILRHGLLHGVGSGWSVLALLCAALAPQVLRTRAGALHLWGLIGIAASVIASTVVLLQFFHFVLPATVLLSGVLASAAVREAVESKAARLESGRLLVDLLRHHKPDRETGVPRSPAARLAALRELQAAVLAEDNARRTLLEGMRDGVVMWDAEGRTVVDNGAVRRLWGHTPARSELEDLDDGQPMVVHRNGLRVAVAFFAVGGGRMALLRDVSAEHELEQKRRDMQRLVSHELKTPLASIAGLGETLQRYELSPEEQQRVATLIRGEAVRLGEMVATFLDLERLAHDPDDEPTEPLDLGELVRQRLEILSESARARTQRISTAIEAGAVVRGSEALLSRVIDNLVGNAIKYSAENDAVEVGVRRDGSAAVLTVADHGPGIPNDALPHLFERFYRVPGTRGAGSGLGLAVAHEIVIWHGGCIEVDSIVDRGSTFTVRLPAEDERR